jgi:hypothetical protein
VCASKWGAGVRPFCPTVRLVVAAVVITASHTRRGGLGGDRSSAAAVVAIAVTGGFLRHLGGNSQQLVITSVREGNKGNGLER